MGGIRKGRGAQAVQEQDEDAGRWRQFRWAGLAVLGLAVIGGSAWGVRHLLNPLTLPIRSIEVEGRFQHLNAKELRRALGGTAAGGFFTVNIDAIQKRVMAHPWVAWASVRRVWPDTVQIRIEEHQPLARWDSDGLVDTDGVWFAAAQDESSAKLPEFIGPKGFQMTLTKRYRDINELLQPLGLRVSRLSVNDRRAWEAALTNGVELTLGRDDVEQRLKRFVRAYPTVLAQRSGQIAGVDLRYTNGFAVRWKAGQSPRPDSKGG